MPLLTPDELKQRLGAEDVARLADRHELGGNPTAVVAALAAWSARETYRVRMEDLGEAGARPVDPAEYERLRTQALAQSGR